MRLFATLIVLSAAMLGACAPQPASQQAASAANTRHSREDPQTGTMFGGTDDQGLSSGYNDPSMATHSHTTGGGS